MGNKSLKKPKAFVFKNKSNIVKRIVSSTITQHKDLQTTSQKALKKLAKNCINEIEFLHNIPDLVNPPANIDVVWAISAPGLLLSKGSKKGWSSKFPWLDNCEKEVIGKSLELIAAITAKRLNKRINQIKKDDVLSHGPWLIYNVVDYESDPLRQLLKRRSSKVPLEKSLIYGTFLEGGKEKNIFNTADQALSIKMPVGIKPRKIAICVLAAQWVRLGKLLAKTKKLPNVSKIIVVPIKSPIGYEDEHAIMESRGTLVNFFKLKRALNNSIPYYTFTSENSFIKRS